MDQVTVTPPQFLTHAWGRSQVVCQSPTCELLRSVAKAGGCSSEHCHRRKSHALVCVSGLVLVEYRGGRTVCLAKDDATVIEAGRWHRLSFPHDAEFLEIGYGEAVSLADIHRADRGRPGRSPRHLHVYDGQED